MTGRRPEGHPGVPEYCEGGSGPLGCEPAARVVKRSPREGGGGETGPSVRTAEGPAAAASFRALPARAPILGDIVERQPATGGPRPPSGGAPRGPDRQPKVVAAGSTGDQEGEYQEIDAENRKVLASMSDQDILAEQALLKKTLPPRLVERWSRPPAHQ